MKIEELTNSMQRADLLQWNLWRTDAIGWCRAVLGLHISIPVKELRNKEFTYETSSGEKKTTKLFDDRGRLTHYDLSFYTRDMFRYQDQEEFKKRPNMLTWQQTVELEAYDRAINTFGQDNYDRALRQITVRAGNGIGKTSMASIMILHFLFCFKYCQIASTANTESQLKDVFLKEFYVWHKRLPESLQNEIEQLDNKIRIRNTKDWFLRARVGSKDKPEALAGLHGKHVFFYADEASGIADKVFETMHGSLTGENWIVLLSSNPTRTEGYFYDSHKPANKLHWTQLHFNSNDSPVVKPGYVKGIIDEYGKSSDEYKVRVSGDFTSVGEMDTKGWIPLFANITIQFEEFGVQVIKGAIIGVDPSGQGKDRTIITARDEFYLKEVLNEATSSETDLARKIETIAIAYNSTLNDVGIDAFGIGAKVIAKIHNKIGEMPNALLTDKPREEVKDRFNSYKAELAWKFREWVLRGGIIVTNNQKDWMRELSLIKYKRDNQGRIKLMGKLEFKKEYGFSPDKFDSAIYTFFRDEPSRQVVFTKEEMENKSWRDYIQKIENKGGESMENLSTM